MHPIIKKKFIEDFDKTLSSVIALLPEQKKLLLNCYEAGLDDCNLFWEEKIKIQERNDNYTG